MVDNVANAFATAPCWEKIWTVAGLEFGPKQGSIIRINRALYGLATSSSSFHEFIGDLLRRMRFEPSRADQDLSYKISEDETKYEYIATHVDNLIIAAVEPQKYMVQIEQELKVCNVEGTPSYYLANEVKKNMNKYIPLSSKTYINKVIRKYEQEHGTLKR